MKYGTESQHLLTKYLIDKIEQLEQENNLLNERNTNLVSKYKGVKSKLFLEEEKNMLLEMKLYNQNPEYFKEDRVSEKEVCKEISKKAKVIPFPNYPT